MRRVLLLTLLGGGGGISYIARAEFTTPASAPLSSPYSEGVGSWTIVDTPNKLSKSGGDLVFGVPSSAAYANPRIYTPVSRATGRVFQFSFSTTLSGGTDSEIVSGFYNNAVGTTANTAHCIYASDAGFLYRYSGGALAIGAYTVGSAYEIALILLTSGCLYLIKGGSFTTWTLIFAEYGLATSSLFALLGGSTGAATPTNYQYLRVRDLASPFNSDYGMATFTDVTLASNDTFIGNADGIHVFEFTLSGTPSANDEISMYYRGTVTDGWKAYIKRNAGNTAWDLLIDSVVASTPTNRLTVTGVSTPDAMEVRTVGNLHDVFTREGTAWTKRGIQVNNSTLSTGTNMALVAVAGTTLTRLTELPYTSTIYDTELNKV